MAWCRRWKVRGWHRGFGPRKDICDLTELYPDHTDWRIYVDECGKKPTIYWVVTKVKAMLKVYGGAGARQTPFVSGYRPIFHFVEESGTDGQITLLDSESMMYPGQQALVEILFPYRDWLGAGFGVGSEFTFSEGGPALGEGTVVDVLEI
jgi:elongation factor Tu